MELIDVNSSSFKINWLKNNVLFILFLDLLIYFGPIEGRPKLINVVLFFFVVEGVVSYFHLL